MEKNIGSRENDLTDRLVKFSIKDKSVVDLLPADEDNCASLSLDRNGYISWENNNQYNYKMYDYKNNKIINVIDKEKLKDYNHVTYTVKDGILNVSCDKDGNGQVTTQYYDLSKKKN